MAFDTRLDDRIRQLTQTWQGIESKRMFGGVGYLIHGHMVCGVHKNALVLRLGEPAASMAIAEDGVGPFDITGRPMRGWVMVASESIRERSALERWIAKARSFVITLPPKNRP